MKVSLVCEMVQLLNSGFGAKWKVHVEGEQEMYVINEVLTTCNNI